MNVKALQTALGVPADGIAGIGTFTALFRKLGASADRATSLAIAANVHFAAYGIMSPLRLAHFMAQLVHESGSFRYMEEIASGAAYEGRADLGNTEPGDGPRFKGRTPIQITGRSNYRQFREWCKAANLDPPNFEAYPELVLTDPWEGLGPVWYWTTRGVNALADVGDLRGITRKINGGYNGLPDRQRYYVRSALVMLGYAPDDVAGFQAKAGLPADGIAGPLTMNALHVALRGSEAVVATEVPPAPSLLGRLIAALFG